MYRDSNADLFKYLSTKGIGLDNAKYYVARSGFFEDSQNYKEAESSLEAGLRRITNQEQKSRLKLKKQEFLSRQEQRRKHEENSEENEPVEYSFKRNALSVLRGGNENTLKNNENKRQNGNQQLAFSIYEDKKQDMERNNEVEGDGKANWVPDEYKEKENVNLPKQWTGNKIKQKTHIVESNPEFEIHVDQAFQESGYKPSSQVALSNQQKDRKKVDDDDDEEDDDDENANSRAVLQNRNLKNRSLKPTQKNSSKSSSSTSSSSKSKSSSSSKGSVVKGFDEDLLCDGAFSFEEIRMKHKREAIFRKRKVEKEKLILQKEREQRKLLEIENERLQKEIEENKKKQEELLESKNNTANNTSNKRKAFGVVSEVKNPENTQKSENKKVKENLTPKKKFESVPETTMTINLNNFELQTVYDDTIKLQNILDGENFDVEEPTINTKNAMKQLSQVYNAKIEGEDDPTRTLKNIPNELIKQTLKKTNGELLREMGVRDDKEPIEFEDEDTGFIESSSVFTTGAFDSNQKQEEETFEIFQDKEFETGEIQVPQMDMQANDSFEIFHDDTGKINNTAFNDNDENEDFKGSFKQEMFKVMNEHEAKPFQTIKQRNLPPPMTPIIEQEEIDESSSNKSCFTEETQSNINRSSLIEKNKEKESPSSFASIELPESPSLQQCKSVNVWKEEQQKEIFSKVFSILKKKEAIIMKDEESPSVDEEVDFDNYIYVLTRRILKESEKEIYLVQDVSFTNLDINNIKYYLLKFHSLNAGMWEYYISSEISLRLKEEKVSQNFVKAKFLFSYTDKEFLLLDTNNSLSLFDLLNVHQKQAKRVDETLVIFYALEMMKSVFLLHRINLIHGNINLHSFLLNKQDSSNSKENSLMLINFQQSIDCNFYDSNTIFQGSLPSDNNFKQVHPYWSFHVDFYCLASTVYCLLFQQQMKVFHDENSNKFTVDIPPNFSSHSGLWKFFFGQLLNFPLCTISQSSSHALPYLENVCKVFENYFFNNKSLSSRLGEAISKQNVLLHEFSSLK